MPVVVEITGRKWKKLAERIARNHSLSEGVIKGRGKMVIFSIQNIMKVTPTERARRNKEVSIGFTLFGVTDKRL